MKPNHKKIYKTILKIFLGLFSITIILVFVAYFYRDTILKTVLSKVENKFRVDYNCTFSVKEAKFDGLSGVSLSQISLIPQNKDTLLYVEKIKTKFSFMQLVTGDLQLNELDFKNGFVQLIKNQNGRNFDAFIKSKPKDSTETTIEKRNYAEFAYSIINKSLNLFPEKISLENLSFRLDDLGKKVTLKAHKLTLKNHQLQTLVNVETNTFSQNWKIEGFANPREKKVDLQIKNNDTTQIRVPFLDQKYNLISSFDNLHFKINKVEMDGDELHFDGYSSVENLTLNHPKIAKQNVVFKNSSFDFKFLFGSDFVAIDTSSIVKLNQIKMQPYVEYNTQSDVIYTLRANIKKMKAQDFINSLPTGLFSHFEGMQATGEFDYKLNFQFNKNKPWKLIFDSKLNKKNVLITKYGEANLSKLNTEFEYSAIDNGKQQRPILVGKTNLNYFLLAEISPYLQKCVLTSEDPSFMTHRGFVTEAFRQSIIKNIRTNKFSRGASTISMQLIKNVFLTREKTMSRKLEEILLVYILENNRIATKERMLEVYFNIIEWGPDVYGIGEAAEFYFNKTPIELTLKECLYLASIIPSPKKFMYLFDEQGNIKEKANKQQEFIKKIMLKRALLLDTDTIGQSVPVKISGLARGLLNIKLQDSIPIDSIQILDLNIN